MIDLSEFTCEAIAAVFGVPAGKVTPEYVIESSLEEPQVIARILAHTTPEHYQPELPLKVAGPAAAIQPDLTQRGGDSAGRWHGGKDGCAPTRRSGSW
jgi:hypothetical protein